MLKGMLTNVFGTRHERERKRVQPIVNAINEEYERLQSVSEDELKGQTERFRERIREATGELETRVAELKELKKTTSDDVVYKLAGPLLVKSDRDNLIKELEEKKELSNTRTVVLGKQESRVKENLKEVENKINQMMHMAQGGSQSNKFNQPPQ